MELRVISDESSKVQRNMREKARRAHMRSLLSNLAAVLHTSTKSMPNLIDEAAVHIEEMKLRINDLDQRKTQVRESPVLKISCSDYTVEVNLITCSNKNFMLHEVLQILQEQGAEVCSLSSCHRPDDRVIYNIKCQAMSPNVGIETSKIVERLHELVFSN